VASPWLIDPLARSGLLAAEDPMKGKRFEAERSIRILQEAEVLISANAPSNQKCRLKPAFLI